jgi:signal transduction histidine kinase
MGRSHNLRLCAALIVALTGTLAAQQYTFRYYGSAEGLQNMTVLSLAQDREGYIWAGTEGGLYRYDGTRFRLMGPAEGLPCGHEIHTLYVASDGALWTNACAQIFRFDGQAFHPVPIANGHLQGAQRIAEEDHGHVIISTTAGLQEVMPAGGSAFTMLPYHLTAALQGKPTYGILRHGEQLWFGCDHHLCVEQGGRVSVFGPAQGLPEEPWDAIGITPDGSVWARSPSRLFRKPPGTDRVIEEKPDIGTSMFWGALTIGKDGSVIVPTDQGLAIRSASGWTVVDRRRGLQRPMTSAALEDREGSLWIGLIGAGLTRCFGRGEWESWTEAQGLPSDVVWSILRDRKGALWVGTAQGLARMEGQQPFRTWTRKDGLGGENVRWLGQTSDGSIWAVSRPGGLARLEPAKGRIHRVSRQDLDCDTLGSIFVDRLDRVWLATACGVFLNIRPAVSDRFVRIDQPESLQRRAWYLAMDSEGAMWITNPDGLWRLDKGVWNHYGKPEGLVNGDAYVPILAPDGSLWLRHRTDAGVERLQLSGDRIVRVDQIVPANRESNDVTALHGFDAFGNFWRGTANGVAVLRANAWTQMSTEDGLISNDTDGEAFWADRDGSVWIGTSGGLAHYRPPSGGLKGLLIADPVISRMEIDQKSRVVRAEFSTLSYKNEQLARFAYRLDGDRWTDTTERVLTFAGIAPGEHRLEIQSRVRDGPVSAKVAVAEFQIEPKWWETWWLRTAAMLLVAAAVWGLVMWRQEVLRSRNRQLEEAVRQRTAELARSNTELVQFAYVASHDLQEPLRMVSSYVQLLARRYAGKLDADADEFIAFAVDGAKRMQNQINDLLAFSRVTTKGHEFKPVEVDAALKLALANLKVAIEESQANVTSGPLPVVNADSAQLTQLFQNLIGNAIKFRRKEPPRVHVSVEKRAKEWEFSVRDNGIGIEPQHLERIFVIFQRLHTAAEFPGTGIGLAICKKIAERHGGNLWVTSESGVGSNFHFTIPVEGS